MKNNYLLMPLLLLVGTTLASCTQVTSSESVISLPNTISENIISEDVIEEEVISEDIIQENITLEEVVEEEVNQESSDTEIDFGIWFEASDLMRDPTEEELALAPRMTVEPGLFSYTPFTGEKENFITSFDHMNEGTFNGFSSNSEDPDFRGYAFIMYMNDEFYMSIGVGIGVTNFYGYARNIEEASLVHTLDIYINYSITDAWTRNVEDIVTIHVASFQFQRALLEEIA